MNARIFPALPLFLALALLTACAAPVEPAAAPTPIPPTASAAGMANPASVFCGDHGGKLEIVTAEDGSQSGNCTLPDGTVCDEWAYFRGTCSPNAAPTPAFAPAVDGRNDPKAAAQAAGLAAEKLAAVLNVGAGSVQVLSSELVTWPNACLGLGAADEMCAQVETPGFRVTLSSGGKQYMYRTDFEGKIIRAEPSGS